MPGVTLVPAAVLAPEQYAVAVNGNRRLPGAAADEGGGP